MASRAPTPKVERRSEDYRHEAKRTNNPEAGLQSFDRKVPSKVRYEYDPHLDPQLVWASKAERTSFEVDTVSLHIHERISTQAILKSVQREPAQRSLFADPSLPLTKAIEFYKHDMGWSNRLILGDSLLVMNSLLHRELMGRKIQMIYMDPPYGVDYRSNFQPRIDQQDVKDRRDESLTREPEQIRAYRDTWTLKAHSYLTYLRDRLLLCWELLADTGSIFVQISDENIHHVRELLDEVFGSENFVALIPFRKKTMPLGTVFIEQMSDFLVWYAKRAFDDAGKRLAKYRKLYLPRSVEGEFHHCWYELPDGTRHRMSKHQLFNHALLPPNARVYRLKSLEPSGPMDSGMYDYKFEGAVYKHPKNGYGTPRDGMDNLVKARRIQAEGNRLTFIMYADEGTATQMTAPWTDTVGADDKVYAVQTNTEVLKRCVLMTTDPGDLVFDPTCGSGTTAYAAEQWGRRWITCDTSRVALALARERIMTATFPYYKLAYEKQGVVAGFIYREIPHITLTSIAQNKPAQKDKLYDDPEVIKNLVRVVGPFTVEAINTLDPGEALSFEPIDEHGHKDSSSHRGGPSASVNDHLAEMTDLLRRDGGISVPGKGRAEIEGLRRVVARDLIHAEGTIKLDGKSRRLAVAFGPRFGPVTAARVEDAIREAGGNYDALAVAGFTFDPEVSAFLDKSPPAGLRLLRVQIAPDVLIGDLLKTGHKQDLFAVLGEPDFDAKREKDGWVVTLNGVDVYDPNKNEVAPTSLEEVAAWFVDQDYDGRCFLVGQVFLPAEKGKSFEKLQRALKGIVNEKAWQGMSGFESAPFQAGAQKCIAVKVIDIRGNEVVGVRKLGR